MYTHQQADSLRYAEMKSSMNNKTFNGQISQSTGVKTNIKSRFAFFEEALSQLQNQTRILVQDTHKSMRKCEQMKTTMGHQMMEQYKIMSKDQIKNLENIFLTAKIESENKIKELWNSCKSATQQSEHLKNTVKEIQNRIEKVQVTLGFYNAEEKMNRF